MSPLLPQELYQEIAFHLREYELMLFGQACHQFRRIMENYLNRLVVKPGYIRRYCRHNQVLSVHKLLSAHVELDYNKGLYSACGAGHLGLVRLMATCLGLRENPTGSMLDRGAYSVNPIFRNACRSGNMKLINFLISCGADDWDFGMFGACEYGQCDVAKYMISRGAGAFNVGLYRACKAGQFQTAQLMIAHGAKDFNHALGAACENGDVSLIRLMLDHGADACEGCGEPISDHPLQAGHKYLH